MTLDDDTVHATTVAIGERAVLIRGDSGAGKSDLALRLIDRGAVLVADDRTVLRASGEAIIASAPATIAGLIEVRGIGIVTMPTRSGVPVALIADLGEEERLPAARHERIGGALIPVMAIDPRPASAPLKVELALRRIAGGPA